MTHAIFFYVYAAIAIAGAIGLVTARQLVHGVVSMFATLLSIAAIYLLLGSQFLAAMQLFVYGGAVTVLILFVLMLTRPEPEESARAKRPLQILSAFICLVLFGFLAFTVGEAQWPHATVALHTTESIAKILFSRYVLPFEIAGLALTISLIGAIVLAREDDALEGVEALEPELAPETALAEGAGEVA